MVDVRDQDGDKWQRGVVAAAAGVPTVRTAPGDEREWVQVRRPPLRPGACALVSGRGEEFWRIGTVVSQIGSLID
eukprot:gene38294-53495_t